MSQCLQLVDQFAGQLNQFRVTGDTSAHDLLDVIKLSHEIFRSKINQSIGSLCSKAARLAKTSIIKKYRQHVPRSHICDPHNQRVLVC